MKKLLLLLLLPMVIACSRDEISEPPSSSKSDFVYSTDLDQNVKIPDTLNMENVYTLNEIDNLIKEEFKGYKKVEDLSKSLRSKVIPKSTDLKQVLSGLTGPFTANAVQSKIRSNEKVILSNGDGGLATGVYICDIYMFKAEISLPLNSVGMAEIPNPVGYNNLNEQVLGITSYTNSSATKNEFIVYTLTIHVKYNLLGQYINRVIPTTLQNGFNYTYYYVTF
jgi:hypothetical protein